MNDEDVDLDELGPVDYLVVEFPADKANFSGEIADQLSALTKSGTIRVLDLLFLKKNLDGSVEGFESHEFEDSEVGQLRQLEAELAMLLAEEDVEAIGGALEPGSYAAILVFENVWAAPFAAASAALAGSWSPTPESPSKPWRPRSRPTKQPRHKEPEMLGRDRVGRPGLLGGRPVARTAAVAGTAAVVTRGVRRRGDRRDDRQDRREDRRRFR